MKAICFVPFTSVNFSIIDQLKPLDMRIYGDLREITHESSLDFVPGLVWFTIH